MAFGLFTSKGGRRAGSVIGKSPKSKKIEMTEGGKWRLN
jgi:hypothetical protein